jgi:putative zinc finger/helix-turn-helix YgiT family protein
LATIPYTTEVGHDGRTYTVTIPDLEVGRCERCGEIVLPRDASKRITETFRQQLGHLRPEQIRERRESLGLTQKELAKLIGSADATLSRLETGGQIQHRALDRILRLFFAFENVRTALADEATLARLGLEDHSQAGPEQGPDLGTPDENADCPDILPLHLAGELHKRQAEYAKRPDRVFPWTVCG